MKLVNNRSITIGGWTRIWIVLTAAFFFISYLSASNNYASVVSMADRDYEKSAENAKWAKQHPEAIARYSSDCADDLKKSPNDNLLQLLCNKQVNPDSDLQEAAAERTRAKDDAMSKAWSDWLTYGSVPSIAVGVLFLSIGWIRNGFSKKRITAPR